MSIKSKVIAAAAALTLTSGLAAGLTATSSWAATPSCGGTCINVFSRDFGHHADPKFVLDVLRQGIKVGQPVILFQESNNDPAEDFQVSYQGLVSDFFAAGLVSARVALHYGCTTPAAAEPSIPCSPPAGVDNPAFELEYSPYGVLSGLCVGVASTAVQNEGVTLQPCGASGKTVWIVPIQNITGFHSNYAPVINGSDTNFSHPFVLTYPSGYPTDKPRVQVRVANLTGFANFPFPTVNSNQLWGEDSGVLP